MAPALTGLGPAVILGGNGTGVPPRYGFSTALTSTKAADLASVGRDGLERLDFRGVAKLDLKRAGCGSKSW